MTNPPDIFARLHAQLAGDDVLAHLQEGLIGDGVMVPGPTGPHPLIYADYVASGRAIRQIEALIATDVLPFYSNAHTEASFCGRVMNRMRADARRTIAEACHASDGDAVIFAGSGATAGLTKLRHVSGLDAMVAAGSRPLVLVGPYEHHSNILPWRESGAEVLEVSEAEAGGPDMAQLSRILSDAAGRPVLGAFSAASNVTGILTDVAAVTRLLKRHGAFSIWDYAGGAPYLPIDMRLGMDAITLSPHKFIGGPGASGVLILRRDAVRGSRPSHAGGGTVRFVSPWGQDYACDVVAREEAGTPNVIGDIRAALCFVVKQAIGQARSDDRLETLRRRARAAWSEIPGLTVLGNPESPALPIFSFLVQEQDGTVMHPQLVCRVLSDHFGIQARGGCACAGPYAHRLLGLDRDISEKLRGEILAGNELAKPGWTRLAFSVLMDDHKAGFIIDAVARIARDPHRFASGYVADARTARFAPRSA